MRHVYMWRFKKANVFKGKKIFSLCQGAFYKNLKTFIKQLSTFVYETLRAVKIWFIDESSGNCCCGF